MERIGLFGGSFDPVHLGHLLVAQAACEELQLNRLVFVVAQQSPFKPEQGASSFRRRDRLTGCLEEARAQVARLAKEREHPDPGVSRREQRARERAAREREERVTQALEYLPQAQAAKERQQQTLATAKRGKVSAPRTSTTDPEARVMKMPDGGFRPAYNVELATSRTGHRQCQWGNRWGQRGQHR